MVEAHASEKVAAPDGFHRVLKQAVKSAAEMLALQKAPSLSTAPALSKAKPVGMRSSTNGVFENNGIAAAQRSAIDRTEAAAPLSMPT